MMWRFFGRFMRSITKTWHMFFVGLIFGIGFDTATEVLLLAATAAAATEGLRGTRSWPCRCCSPGG